MIRPLFSTDEGPVDESIEANDKTTRVYDLIIVVKAFVEPHLFEELKTQQVRIVCYDDPKRQNSSFQSVVFLLDRLPLKINGSSSSCYLPRTRGR